jgi:hypothetical protein
MKTSLLSLLLLCSSVASAQTYATWGVGVGHPKASASPDKNKFIEFGVQRSHKLLESRFGVGGWTDKSKYPGARDSYYIQAQLGVETKRDGVYLAYFVGPALIQKKDSLLGSHLQFSQSLEIGLIDTRRVAVALVVRHFSNAGLTTVNKGRNYVGPQVRF